MTSSALIADSGIQKRALSYAITIHKLFFDVMESKQPADNILANYFRENKKHGSKDRRIIRETFFGLFRWWGWIHQLQPTSQQEVDSNWLKALVQTASFEQHAWLPIINAWAEVSALPDSTLEKARIQDSPLSCANVFADNNELHLNQLLPESFWQHLEYSTEQSELLANIMQTRPPIWARSQGINHQQAVDSLISEGVDIIDCQYFANALSLGEKSLNLTQLTTYKQGKLEIQDLASQVIGEICQPKPNELWWDTCSGAGGKALQLQSLRNDKGKLVASDIRLNALSELKKRANKAKFKNIKVMPWVSETLPVSSRSFDGVLVDAPCSCTGTWRRNPDMRWTDDLSNLDEITGLQLDILTRSAEAVKQGGKLVYATCSLLPQENEQVIKAFLEQSPEFELIPIVHPFTQAEQDMVTIMPYEANSDGMFVVVMKRQTEKA
ncbi:RsmB/NOP family class I SAM-dependent RNA methyltransferase [Parashewanella curva]|uniref:RsmB/NOP family class I SAM-dependent RNA methyltransferase n=1 Tax=Parashewanella curva TaxID=2338552 RepID=A0A3L8Q391_9GAMM|nr:RsmB/NOP family class I SAM-dependent RNA methyltransferase [Parashewanella curva]RLV61503.1 RsmB/NOP family class I SAM-dependent RNA methyltransferase [Parashewanella curva]